VTGLVLPTLVLDAGGVVREVDPAWTADERARVRAAELALDPGGEAVVALPGRSWAVGRRGSVRSRWVRVSGAVADRVGGHPAWLWTEDGWLDPVRTRELRAPAALPLRHLAGAMGAIGGRRRRAVKAFAAAIAALRAGNKVAVRVSPELLASASRPARAFLLAWTTAVPRAARDRLSIAVGAVGPGFDLAVTDRDLPGSLTIDAEDPPDEGEDLVAYFLRNRLYADDPESVESAAWMFDGAGDAWGEGVASRIRDGLPGPDNDPALLENDPERAVRALTARLRAGAPLDRPLTEHLVAVTTATRDPRPFRALAGRTDRVRADAIDELLGRALRPSGALIEALTELLPRGTPLDRWLPALLQWLSAGLATPHVLRAIEVTLLEWPLAATAPTRVSVWSEVVAALVRLGHDEQAMDALTGPVAAQIALDGAGRALVAGWATVPAAFRDKRRLDRLVGLLRGVPDGDVAAADLLRLVRWREDEATVVVRSWLGHSVEAPTPADRLFEAVRETVLVRDWAEALASGHLPRSPALLAHWGEVVAGLVAQDPLPDAARDDLLRLPLPVVAVAGLPLVERVVAAEAPRALSRLAAGAAREEGASPVWGLLAVALGDPTEWDEAVVDGTVVEFLDAPGTPAEYRVARLALVRLGQDPNQAPIDLARWVVRLVHGAHRSKGSAFLAGLAAGLRARADGVATTAAVVDALLHLDREHPATLALLQVLPEAGWTRTELPALLAAVGPERIPADLLARLQRAGW
jgi:hypothetical protein